MELTTIFTGIQTGESLLSEILGKRGTRIQKKIEAVTCMQRAINRTQIFLNQIDYVYQPNETLAELWLNAFTAMIPVDKNIAIKLRTKSKFWSNPQEWLGEENAMELVPSLQELDQKCEMLLIELNARL